MWCSNAVLIFLSFCLTPIAATISCWNNDDTLVYTCLSDQYCCGYMECCDTYDSVWGLWYFWLIMIFCICILSSCVGCCVRAARQRRLQRYYQIRSQPAVYGSVVVAQTPVTHVPPQAPPYIAQPPPYQSSYQPPSYK